MASHQVPFKWLIPRPSTDNHPNSVRPNTDTAATQSEGAFVLGPEFRDRLIESLDRVGVPVRGRLSYVASLTRRAVQTVSRWLDPERPGLPDLESFARLCDGLGRNSDWMLGRGETPSALGAAHAELSVVEASWVNEVFVALRSACRTCEPLRMAGDEMAPQIEDGDLMFVDRAAHQLVGNGIYALELGGRFMVRRLENRLDEGLVFKCEKPGYADCVVQDAAAAERLGLCVIGKVRGAVGVTRFWWQ